MGLRELRRSRGWTLEAVAYLADLDPATISRLERGATRQPGRETVVALAQAYGVSVQRMVRLLEEAREATEASSTAQA
jgi:transcriptional regulator with XRE-family HTH domain